jgi:Rps23 Pro-64 3,4-dihydroxylase Tpa1-like proline 4-hydroxylase
MTKPMLTIDAAQKPNGEPLRCPHAIFRNALGAETVSRLRDYVAVRQRDFKPAKIRDRGKDAPTTDYDRRVCLLLPELGEFRTPVEAFVRRIAPMAMTRLGLIEPAVAPREFEISAHGDGGHFAPHLDTTDRLGRVRVLSCVYYFFAMPRRFHGGELRLFGFPSPSGGTHMPPPFVDIVPESDMLVAFPSWLTHAVLPVRVPSGAWADYRFAVNCWIHRLTPQGRAEI